MTVSSACGKRKLALAAEASFCCCVLILAILLCSPSFALAHHSCVPVGRGNDRYFIDRLPVKQFAQRMVKDHTEALNQLQQLAQSKNITLPDGLPSDAQDLQQKLSSDRGKQLDSDYMSGMVEDHQKDVQEFQDAAQNLKDPDLKQWASKTLPTLQQHLQMAQAVDSKIKGGKAASSSSRGSR
jgi:uncharacterized protein DUF4142